MLRTERTITDEQWMDFYRSGYLKLGSALEPEELSALQARIDDIMLGRVDNSKLYMQLDKGGDYSKWGDSAIGGLGKTLEYRKIQNLEHDALFLAFMRKPLFREICERVYGAHLDFTCLRAMFMNKPAHKGTHLPWHQDGGTGWGLDRDPVVTVWTALDPATRANGCVKIVPGSHHLGLLSQRGHVIDQDLEKEICTPEKVVYLEVEAGECVLLHNFLLHASGVNESDIARRAFSVCYMDGRTRHTGKDEAYFKVFESEVPEHAEATSVYA